MSNVRVSNGSPTLERMEAAARQADYPKPSACRNLFGPVNHDELARYFHQHRLEQDEANRARWNFDFHRHQPLDGRYEWQALSRDALPDFYSRPPRLSKALASQLDDATTGRLGRAQASGPDEQQQQQQESLGPPQKTETAGTPTDSAGHSAGGQRKRPASDDSSPRNKRVNMTEEAISEDSPSANSAEQTPKKSSPRRRQT